MSYQFKIWNQSNDAQTMAIRAQDVNTLAKIASSYNAPSTDGQYNSLGNFLNQLNSASSPLSPYRRSVDVFWNTALGYGKRKLFADRVIEATYTGTIRQSGGFAAQCYVMIDPGGYGALGQFHLVPITVAIVPGGPRDLLIVTV